MPLAIVPPAIAAALTIPVPLDPVYPVQSAPAWIWLLLLLAAAAPAVAVVAARRTIADSRERNRLLGTAGALVAVATALVVAVALVVAPPLLVRGGGAWILIAAGAAAVPLLAAFVSLDPLSRFRWGLLVGESAVALTTAFLLRDPRGPDEYVRHVMTLAPGYGATSLAVLVPRSLAVPAASDPGAEAHVKRYESRLRAAEATLARMFENGAFAPPHDVWADDARILHAFVAARAAASPAMGEEDSARYLRIAVAERLAFAASPRSSLEPWTRGGILPKYALEETEGLTANADLRLRVHAAWSAIVPLATALKDPALEREAITLVRTLFADEKLDRTHHILLATYSLERRRLVEAGDAPGLIAFFDRLAGEDFPEEVKKSFVREATFLRDHADEEYRPVIELLRARVLANGGDGDLRAAREAYQRILGTWPQASIAADARAELEELGPP